MSRTLLIIICDFLLLSLLALVDFQHVDKQKPSEVEREISQELSEEGELIDLLEVSLELERSNSNELQQILAEAQIQLEAERQSRTAEAQTFFTERKQLNQTIEGIQENLKAVEDNRRVLMDDIESSRQVLDFTQNQLLELTGLLEKRDQSLEVSQQQVAELLADRSEAEGLNNQLLLELQRLQLEQRSISERLQDREQSLKESNERISSLKKQQEEFERRSRDLESELKVVQKEKVLIAEALDIAKDQIDSNRVEEETIQQIVETTTEIRETIETLPASQTVELLSPNTIFQNYQDNRISIEFAAKYPGRPNWLRFPARTSFIITKDGQNYAIVYSPTTPLNPRGLRGRGQWPSSLLAFIKTSNNESLPVKEVFFPDVDPRIILIPIHEDFAPSAGITPFDLATDPFAYKEAIIISNNKEDEYDLIEFKVEPKNNDLIRIVPPPFSLFNSRFNPKRSDFIFSQTGELIGLMVNNQYGLLLQDLSAYSALSLGRSYDSKQAKELQKLLKKQLQSLPISYQ